ncbi:MAG: hypothetical protein IH948_09565, partial [Bacteroidetes bacterium]|nr:hypothetical protein [Bacteroidota bacterium]
LVPNNPLLGGPTTCSYDYDDLYRLTHADAEYQTLNFRHRYSLDMDYSPNGRIENKDQKHDRKSLGSPWLPQKKTSYEFDYNYDGAAPNQPTHIGDKTYTWDANGNYTGWDHDKNGTRQKMLWDEENRIRAVANNGQTHHYIYDGSGVRVIKATGDGQGIYVNGFPFGGSGTVGNYTMYVSPYVVVQNAKYTKHFFIGDQRIVSKIGEMGDHFAKGGTGKTAGKSGKVPPGWEQKKNNLKDHIIANFLALGLDQSLLIAGKSGKIPYGQIKKYFRENGGLEDGGIPPGHVESLQYFYHPDHLGSASYITDAAGEVYQHMEYFAFGETFIEERHDAEYTTYLFNGKELDEETGNYYYGARYYNPQNSIWLSIDPLADKYPSLSPYNFVANNPLKLVDPDGTKIWIWYTGKNKWTGKMVPKRVYLRKGKLYNPNGKAYTGNNEYVLKVEVDLFLIGADDSKLRRRIGKLERSKRDHVIRMTRTSNDGNSNATDNPARSDKGKRTGSITYYDPDKQTRGRGSTGQRRDPTVGLVHELLGHGYERNNGSIDGTKYGGVKGAEISAINIENRRRAITQDPKRTKYIGIAIPAKLLKKVPKKLIY